MKRWKIKLVLSLFVWIVGFVIVSTRNAIAQQQDSFTFDFHEEPLIRAIEIVEARTSYRFYFSNQWLLDISITKQISASNIEEVVGMLIEGTTLQFVVLSEKVIITNNAPIITSLNLSKSELSSAQYLFEREYETGLLAGEVVVIGDKSKLVAGEESLVAGFVRSDETGEALTGAVVFIPDANRSTVTDSKGFYTISVPNGKNELVFRISGLQQEKRNIMVFSDGSLNMSMEPEAILLDEVSILADADVNITDVKMGVSTIDMEGLKNIPKVLGENDLVQIMLTLPGVQNIGEGASGINVRGGKTDQNLILFNNATVYNPFHFFGFFSAFNADLISNTELYKSSIPANYGGRLSSLLDVKMKTGNKERFTVKGGISPITSQLSFETPLVKDKTSLIAGVRTTYSDWILNQVNDESISNSDPTFVDVGVGIDHSYGDNNSINASVYYSRDQFRITTDSLYSYHNFNAALNWKHLFNDKLSGHIIATTSQYAFDIAYDLVPESAFNYGFEINDVFGQAALNYLPNQEHDIRLGADVRLYDLAPGFIFPIGDASEVQQEEIAQERGRETSFFISDDYKPTERLNFSVGLRYSIFSALGGRTVNFYEQGLPRNEGTLQSSVDYASNEVIDTYHGPEIRLSARYSLPQNSSIKAGFTTTRQYIHSLSNNVSISPTDTWKLSDPNFAPQFGRQFSLGYFRNLEGNKIEASVEAYYKTFENLLDYKVGADLVLNPSIEVDVIQGTGKAYGVELLLRKKTGKLNGWVGYTYSRSQQRFNSQFAEERINNGAYFSSNHEKPHDFSLVSNYKYTRRFSFSMNVAYSTGRPITYPTAKYNLSGNEIVHFSDRNAFRIPNYFRIDLSFNIEGSHKVKKLAHSFWSFSIYNVTARKNVYSVFFVNEGGQVQGYELSVLGTAIPSITYNFKF
ncbi:MAG: TonB-dependent receptor [Cyclobacteriaceae bacterium]